MGHCFIGAPFVDGDHHEDEASDKHECVRVEKVTAIVLNFGLELHLEECSECDQVRHEQDRVKVLQLLCQVHKEQEAQDSHCLFNRHAADTLLHFHYTPF